MISIDNKNIQILHEKIGSSRALFFERREALTLLKLLIDWAETYQGKGTVCGILENRKEFYAEEEKK